MTEKIDCEFKILVIGETDVGKTLLTRRFKFGNAKTSGNTIVADLYQKGIVVKEKRVKLLIYDIAGQREYKENILGFFKNVDGVILVYDVTNLVTFSKLSTWLQQVRDLNDEFAAIIVGNKLDHPKGKSVSSETAKRYAKNEGLEFVETSAMKGDNVGAVFECLTEIILRNKQLVPPDISSSVPSSISSNASYHFAYTARDSYSTTRQPWTTESDSEGFETSEPHRSLASPAIATSTKNTEMEKKMARGCTLNVIMIGDRNVGKTCMVARYVKNEYDEFNSSTIGVDYHFKTVELNGIDISLHIWDTAGGQDSFRCVVPQYFRPAHGAILVYDVCRYETFVHVTNWIEEFRHYNETAAMILVGNKKDAKGKAVSRQQVKPFAATHQFNFVECSARSGENINQVFEILIEEMLKNADIDDLPEDDRCIRVTNDIELEKKKPWWKQCF